MRFNLITKNRTYVRKIEIYLTEKKLANYMIEVILDSKTKIKIAKLFAEREESFQVSDVARTLKISKSRASECLRDLAQKGFLESKVIGRSTLYKISSSRIANMVSASLTQEKVLLAEIEKSAIVEIKKLRPVSFALFGSALRGLKIGSDVDFFLLYKNGFEKERIYSIASMLTEKFGFYVSILAMDAREFKTKARRGEEFVINVLANHRLLYGEKLEEAVW